MDDIERRFDALERVVFEIAALDYLAFKWRAGRSDVIRSLVVGAALAQLDRLDDGFEPSFDALVASRASTTCSLTPNGSEIVRPRYRDQP